MQTYTASNIIDALGEDLIQARLGFSKRNIIQVRYTGKFAGMWYAPVLALCSEHHVYCPMDCFQWKAVGKKNEGQAHESLTGQ